MREWFFGARCTLGDPIPRVKIHHGVHLGLIAECANSGQPADTGGYTLEDTFFHFYKRPMALQRNPCSEHTHVFAGVGQHVLVLMCHRPGKFGTVDQWERPNLHIPSKRGEFAMRSQILRKHPPCKFTTLDTNVTIDEKWHHSWKSKQKDRKLRWILRPVGAVCAVPIHAHHKMIQPCPSKEH